ncbi:hypothetical protein [Campylobacter showae]|nr:hypothetical protein [Campylobacter showae]
MKRRLAALYVVGFKILRSAGYMPSVRLNFKTALSSLAILPL